MRPRPRKRCVWLTCVWLTVIFFLISTFPMPFTYSSPMPFTSSSPMPFATSASPALSLVFAKRALAGDWLNYYQGTPASAILAVDENCPIAVEHEQLVFDLIGEKGFAMQGKVRASYEMVNPTDQHLSVQMAFPIASSIDELSAEDITITVDETPVDYEIFLGDKPLSFDKNRNEDFLTGIEKILSTFSRGEYRAKHFALDDTITERANFSPP